MVSCMYWETASLLSSRPQRSWKIFAVSLIGAARISSSSSCVHSWFVCLMSPNSTSRQVFIESSRHPSQSKMIPLAFANFSNMHRLSCVPR